MTSGGRGDTSGTIFSGVGTLGVCGIVGLLDGPSVNVAVAMLYVLVQPN